MSDAAWAAIGVIATALLTYLSTRYTTNRQNETKNAEANAAGRRDAADAWQEFAEKMEASRAQEEAGRAELAAKVRDLDAEVADLRTEMAELRAASAAKDAQIATNNALLAAKDEQLVALEAECRAHESGKVLALAYVALLLQDMRTRGIDPPPAPAGL